MSHSTPPELQVRITLQSIWIERSGIKQNHEVAWDKCIPAKFSLSRDKEMYVAKTKNSICIRAVLSVSSLLQTFCILGYELHALFNLRGYRVKPTKVGVRAATFTFAQFVQYFRCCMKKLWVRLAVPLIKQRGCAS